MCASRTVGVQPSGVTVGSVQRSSGICATTASNAAAPRPRRRAADRGQASAGSSSSSAPARAVAAGSGRNSKTLPVDATPRRRASRPERRERAVDALLLEPRLQPGHLVARRRGRSPWTQRSTFAAADLPARAPRRVDGEPGAAGAQHHGGLPRRLRRRGLAARAARAARAGRRSPPPSSPRPPRPRRRARRARSRASSTRSAFVPDDHRRPRRERRVVRGELGPQHRRGRRRDRPRTGRPPARARGSARRAAGTDGPRPLPVGGALDQPGHVGDDEPVPVPPATPRFGVSVVNG